MSPYPPPRFVTKDIYKFVPHPVYAGVCVLAIGISIFAKSASGLWLVSPVLILSCVAFVLGFEKEQLRKRFPHLHFKPLISLPESSEGRPTAWNRMSTYVLVLIPWFILFRMVLLWGMPGRTVISAMPFEARIPVIEFTVLLYVTAYPLVLLAPLFARTKKNLRNFAVSGLMATATGFFIMIVLPLVTPLKTPSSASLWGRLLEFANAGNSSFTSFPCFHVIWTFIAVRSYLDRNASLKRLWQLVAIVIALSCITTGRYSIIDVLGGIGVYWFAENRAAVWRFIQRTSEQIANSWREWDFGRVRLMNHGLYGGLATFAGVLLVASLLGENQLPAIFVVAVTAMIVSALWAQFIEGSKKLLRPLGFYGGVLGVVLGCLLVDLVFGSDFFLIWAGFAVAAPWIQGIGRVRCLVQGCCHGRLATANTGIRYFHHRSRVITLADWRGEYLYPTPVYSILSNIVVGIVLLKLWFASAPLPFIIGMCFILNGLSRFVEESYRGEPQTPNLAGLRLYQWIALIGIILGAVLTTIRYSIHRAGMETSTEILAVAAVAGLLSTFLTGVDFPLSNRRFSRLA